MKKMLLVFAAIVCLLGMMPSSVWAEESAQEVEVTELNQIMVANEALEARELPDNNSTIVVTYNSGDPVFVIGETADGWYKVSYQDKEGYVPKSSLTMQELDIEELDKEFQELEAEGKLVIEEVERYRAEARRSRIWGIVIVLLVVGIFATGIISTTRIEKEKKKKDADDPAPEKKLENIIDLDKEE